MKDNLAVNILNTMKLIDHPNRKPAARDLLY